MPRAGGGVETGGAIIKTRKREGPTPPAPSSLLWEFHPPQEGLEAVRSIIDLCAPSLVRGTFWFHG